MGHAEVLAGLDSCACEGSATLYKEKGVGLSTYSCQLVAYGKLTWFTL